MQGGTLVFDGGPGEASYLNLGIAVSFFFFTTVPLVTLGSYSDR